MGANRIWTAPDAAPNEWPRCPGCGVAVGDEHLDDCPRVSPPAAAPPWEESFADVGGETPWQVEGLWREGWLGMVWGSPGSLKSFFALEACNRVATGTPLAGRETRRARALYVAAEAAYQYPTRQRGWEVAHGGGERTGGLLTIARPVDMLEVSDEVLGIAGRERRSNFLAAGELALQVDNENASGSEGWIGLVVLDSLHACMPDASDASDRDLGLVIERAREFTEAGVSVLLVHHSTISDARERGHGALKAAIDFQYHAKQTAAGLRLKCTKMRNGPDGWELVLARRAVDLGGGSSTLALQEPRAGGGELDEKDVAVLEAVEGGSSTQAEVVEATGLPQPTVSRRLKKLADRGDLDRSADGQGAVFTAPAE
jgi:hypothetical protein